MGRSFRGPDRKHLKEKFLAFKEKRKAKRNFDDEQSNKNIRGNRTHYTIVDDESDWDDNGYEH